MVVVGKQRDLLTGRWRVVRGLRQKEHQFQIAVVELWRRVGRRDVKCWHTPNGEERDERVAAKLKAMGVLPGVPDLIFLWAERGEPRVLFLELKGERGELSAEQEVFADWCRVSGVPHEVVRTLPEAHGVLRKYELLRLEVELQ